MDQRIESNAFEETTMSDTADTPPIITQRILDRAAMQYAITTIRTLSGVCSDLSIRSMSKSFPGVDDLLDECLDVLRDADAILHGQSDPASAASIDAYRQIERMSLMTSPFGRAITEMGAWLIAARLPGTRRNLDAFGEDPIGSLEKRYGEMCFNLKTYLNALDGGTPAERFPFRR